MFSLSTRAMLMALLVLTCAVAPSVYAIVQMRAIDVIIEQSNAAGEVRRALEDVEDLAHDYVQFLDGGGERRSARGLALRNKVLAQLSATRQLIAREVALAGPDRASQEMLELRRVDAIEHAVRSARIGTAPIWQPLIQAAIVNERTEVALDEAIVRRKMGEIRIAILFEALVAALVSIAAVFWLRGNIVQPLQRLTMGASHLADGRYDARVEPGGLRELDATIRQFNHMADEVQAQRGSMQVAQDDLEREVARRTAELRAAHDELAKLAARRSDFLADISHELRTPIAIVRGEADVTLRNRHAAPDEYRESLTRVQRQAEALSRLVDELLFIARHEAGSPALTVGQYDLSDLVRSIADDVRCLVDGDGGAISVDARAVTMVQCDAAKIGQVLRILIDNAIRHNSRPPRIDIALRSAPDAIYVTVRDNGIGIAIDEIEAVFERFSRGTNSRNGADGGSGLGLPLAKAIVEAHGGTIRCESVIGQGTTMRFSLPHLPMRTVA